GMGDNIYLGDRSGVRTPMQWSSDRNGGFSRADPARLFAPPIMDPVYGYEAINVEAQERYPFSLLNWMTRLIAMRKQHRVFGRGSLEIIYPSNRKVLSFLRRDDQETILVVANLSRTVQPAELNLKAFEGLMPIELAGLAEFPRIGDQPYFLTLGPYACYWFTLRQEPMLMTPRVAAAPDPNAAILDALPSLLVGVDWEGLFDAATRGIIEKQALRPFLRRQRWFAAKSRDVRQARVGDWTLLRTGTNPAFLTIVALEYADGGNESYVVPLTLLADAAADRALKETPAAVLARITGARKGAIVDALYDDDTCRHLLSVIDRSAEIATTRGGIMGLLTSEHFELASEPKWVRGAGEQSNSVVIVDERYMLKLYRRIEPSMNPEFEIGRFLTTQGFTRAPAIHGAIEYDAPGLPSATLALVQTAITHQGSGWDFTIGELRRYYERVAARTRGSEVALPVPDAAPPPFFAALASWYLASVTTLGKRTAELHLTLARGTDSAFAPEPLTARALDALADQMRAHTSAALDLLEQRVSTIHEAVRQQADALLANRGRLLSHFDRIRGLEAAGLRIRIHGDYHLGQVLHTEEDFFIIDFEGEPARTFAERRAKYSPLKDVAGMIRSFSYAAEAALVAFAPHASEDFAALEPWADTWQHWATDAFLTAYMSTMGGSNLVPSPDAVVPLLRAFVLEKAVYELSYELNNRPDWVWIPLTGILKLLR
ncbi:MAG: putative maltokinase, partial [Acidobacteria bacterium]|nr:putative maltokinase [Acidobacteriota bacterium]